MPLHLDQFRSRAVIRDGDEPHRASTNLELIFDLVYVVAIARSVAVFHEMLVEATPGHAIAVFAMLFFAVWWSWIGFTWYSNAHDGDTITDRLLTFVQMAGALIIAAGVHQAATDEQFTLVVVGYLVARVGLIAAWLRVARDQPTARRRALRNAGSLVVLQAMWVARIWLPNDLLSITFVLLAGLEMAVPVWSWGTKEELPLHPGHIEERYGLLTIILLGETIAAAVGGFQNAFEDGGASVSLMAMALGALAVAFACWWLYFDHPGHLAPSKRTAFRWGYLHLVVFVALATLGGGLANGFQSLSAGHAQASPRVTALAVAIPVALFLTGLAVLMLVNGIKLTDLRIVPKLGAAVLMVVAGCLLSTVATVVCAALVLLVLVVWMIVAEPVNARGSVVQG